MTHRQTLIQENPEGFDRSELFDIRRRFLLVNSARLARVRAALHDRQQLFLDALQLLFHCNHPLLPGFVHQDTPAGLSGFTLTPAHRAQAAQFSRSIKLTAAPAAQDNIWGLFLMGSLGTIAHTATSDFDIWLCYNPQLAPNAIAKLEEKAEKISRWAAAIGLEVHFFLMNDQAFRAGTMLPMSGESSGSAQRLLLLDEFYRTSLWLGGRQPLWWFIPTAADAAGHYKQQAQKILTQRFLPPEDYLDFGSCAQIEASEFVGAGLWQLYKAIESPYKSVLKLFLLEVYAKNIQQCNPLSSQFKQAVYRNELDVDALDPYLTAYQYTANYLQSEGDSHRLELLRRSLYIKVNKLLSKPPSGRAKSWQRLRMESLVKNWGWRSIDLRHLDNRVAWKTHEVLLEREQLVAALTRSFREMDALAKQAAASVALAGMDFVLLRNKLSAAFAPRPGKVLAINPGISRDVSADWLALDNSQGTWQIRDSHGQTLHAHPRLCAALFWGIYNQVIAPSTQLDVPEKSYLPACKAARHAIHQWQQLHHQDAEHQAFAQAPQITQILLMVNWQAPGRDLAHRSTQLSDKFDPFNYGAQGENRVLCIDALYRNAWGEVFHCEFNGTDALFALLKWYWQVYSGPDQQMQPALTIEVLDHQQSTSIAQRLQSWLADIVQCFGRHNGRQSRYLFALGNQLYCLYWQHDELIPLTIYNEMDLWNFLAVPQPVFRPMVIDRYCLQGHILRVLVKHIQPRTVSVFYQQIEQNLQLIVVDERGSFLRVVIDKAPKMRSLFNLFAFMRTSLKHLVTHNPTLPGVFGVVPVSFYEMQATPTGWQLVRKNFDVEQFDLARVSVKAVVENDAAQHEMYRFYCDGEELLPEAERDIFTTLAQWLVEKREVRELYPIFINEVAFQPPLNHEQLVDYLKMKLHLEQQLNSALQQAR